MFNQACKLFVGGLKVDTNDDGLRKHFEQFGTLIDCAVVPHKTAQRSRCFGFVTYLTPEEADAAMAASPHTVEGNWVEVKRAVPKKQADESEARAKVKKIFVGGLKNDIQEDDLTDYFSQYGEVENSEIMSEKDTGKKRGFGFVHFTDHYAADMAVAVPFHTVNGHRVEVKKSVPKQEMQAPSRIRMTPRDNSRRTMMEHQNDAMDYGQNYGYGNGGGYRGYGGCCCPCRGGCSDQQNGYGGGYSNQQNGYGGGYSNQQNGYRGRNGYKGRGHGQQSSGSGPMKKSFGGQRSSAPHTRGKQ
ncbi:heterogeneous nuclear ribonucleoprotein A0-like [Oryzias latipes]|uniref:heterogeneous nuclear ribonucleoprotein A0-like n=1 Tax=Oryzias latipes TaxID=8090 RepID=UPI0002A4A78C|nr:heterogeneous nuclear ribonucleoprotein A0-like [Oryzias latipes]